MLRGKAMVKHVVSAAAILGIIQSLIWCFFVVYSLLFYFDAVKCDNCNNLTSAIYKIFLKSIDGINTILSEDRIVTAEVFNGFMYPYAALSLIWLGISISMLFTAIKSNRIFHLWNAWSGLVIIISILDITLTALTAYDFSLYTDENSEENGRAAYIIVMSVAARGYLLWILNVTFAAMLIAVAYDVKNKKDDQTRPIINAYSNSTFGSMYGPYSPPSDNNYINPQYNSLKNPTHNSFNNQNNSPVDPYSNNNVFYGSKVDTTKPIGYNANPPSNQQRDFYDPRPNYVVPINPSLNRNQPSPPRLARIGKQTQGRRTPPQNVQPPFVPEIPEPDYTPPGSPVPRIKPALRSTSKYDLRTI